MKVKFQSKQKHTQIMIESYSKNFTLFPYLKLSCLSRSFEMLLDEAFDALSFCSLDIIVTN